MKKPECATEDYKMVEVRLELFYCIANQRSTSLRHLTGKSAHKFHKYEFGFDYRKKRCRDFR